MTDTIVTTRSTPFEFLMSYLKLFGAEDRSISVSTLCQPLDVNDTYYHCAGCDSDAVAVVLKFLNEFDDDFVSFIEYTCTACGERRYSV